MRKQFEGIVRPVRIGDLLAIRSILGEWLRDSDGRPLRGDVGHTLDAISDSIGAKDDRRYLVAELYEVVIGVMGLTGKGIDSALIHSSDKPVEFVHAYVASNQRGTGAGAALADALEELARHDGYTRLIIVSGSRNRETGYPFWNKRYGEPIKIFEDFYGPGVEKVVWSKFLDSL
jgi:GNAT superfamily N-acetyltransferase